MVLITVLDKITLAQDILLKALGNINRIITSKKKFWSPTFELKYIICAFKICKC